MSSVKKTTKSTTKSIPEPVGPTPTRSVVVDLPKAPIVTAEKPDLSFGILTAFRGLMTPAQSPLLSKQFDSFLNSHGNLPESLGFDVPHLRTLYTPFTIPNPLEVNAQGSGYYVNVGTIALDLTLGHPPIPFFIALGHFSYFQTDKNLSFSIGFDLAPNMAFPPTTGNPKIREKLPSSGKLLFNTEGISSSGKKGFFFPGKRNTSDVYPVLVCYDPVTDILSITPFFPGMSTAMRSPTVTLDTTIDIDEPDRYLFYRIRSATRVAPPRGNVRRKNTSDYASLRSCAFVNGFITTPEFNDVAFYIDSDFNCYRRCDYPGIASSKFPSFLAKEFPVQRIIEELQPLLPNNEPSVNKAEISDVESVNSESDGVVLSTDSHSRSTLRPKREYFAQSEQSAELLALFTDKDQIAHDDTVHVVESLLSDMISKIEQDEDESLNSFRQFNAFDSVITGQCLLRGIPTPVAGLPVRHGSDCCRVFEVEAAKHPSSAYASFGYFKDFGTDQEHTHGDFYVYAFRSMNIQFHVDQSLSQQPKTAFALTSARPLCILAAELYKAGKVPKNPTIFKEFVKLLGNMRLITEKELFAEAPPSDIGQGGALNLLLRFVDGVIAAGATAADFFKSLVTTILETITTFFSSIIDLTVNSIWEAFSAKFLEIFQPLIDSIAALGDGVKKVFQEQKSLLVLFIAVAGFCVLNYLNILPAYICSGFLGSMVASCYYKIKCALGDRTQVEFTEKFAKDMEDDLPLSAQGSILPDFLVGLASGIVGGIGTTNSRTLGDYCRTVLALVATGTLAAKGFSYVFSLLPCVLQRALIYRFGTASQKYKYEFDDWLAYANALIKVGRDERILMSNEYLEVLRKTIDRAGSIRKIIPPSAATDRILFLNRFVDLQRKDSILFRYRNQQATRPVPWAVHIFGPPGVGKTTFIRPFLEEVAGITRGSDIFQKPLDKGYWVGYQDQKAIIFDEFLSSKDKNTNQTLCTEYLELVSAKPFVPEMPSMDDPTQGIKGTSVRPTVVITMNNTPYDHVEPYLHAPGAFYGRRRFVIECGVVAGHPMKSPRNIDTSRYTPEELKNFPWMRFRLLPANECEIPGGHYSKCALPPPNDTSVEWVTYADLCAMMKVDFSEFSEESARMAVAAGQTTMETQDPASIIRDTLADCLGVPTKTYTFADLLARFIFAQGPGSSVSTDDEGFKPRKTRRRAHRKAKPVVPPPPPPSFETASETENPPQNETVVFEVPPAISKGIVSFTSTDKEGHPKEANYTPDFIFQIPIRSNYASEQNFEDAVTFFFNNLYTSTNHHADYALGLMFRSIELQGNLTPEEVAEHKLKASTFRVAAQIWHGGYVTRPVFSPVHVFASVAVCLFTLKFLSRILGQKDVNVENCRFVGQSPKKDREEKENTQHRTYQSVNSRRFKLLGQGESDFDPLHAVLTLRCTTSKLTPVTLSAIPLCDRTVLTYRHGFFIKGMTPNDQMTITLQYKGESYTEPFTSELATMFEEDGEPIDVVAYQFTDLRIPNFPNLKQKCIPDSALANFKQCHVVLYSKIDSEVSKRVVGAASRENDVDYSMALPDPTTQTGFCLKKVHLPIALTAVMPSTGGDCGRAWTSLGGSFPGKVYGMHVAGTGLVEGYSTAVAIPLTTERVARFQKLITSIATEKRSLDDLHAQGPWTPELAQLAKLPNIHTIQKADIDIHIPRRTKLAPSVLAPYFNPAPVKLPSVLSIRDKRSTHVSEALQSEEPWKADPVVNQIINTGSVDIPSNPDPAILKRAADDISYSLAHDLQWVAGARHLTIEEACEGLPGVLTNINTATSAGLPLSQITRKRGKKEFVFINPDGRADIDPVFRQLVDETLKDMAAGNPPTTRFTGFLKDELVRPAKIDAAKTRITYCGNMVSSVAFRMKIGCVLAAFNNSGLTTSSAIGLNPYSYDMDNIYHYLTALEKGKPGRFQAGDFQAFDMAHHPVARKLAYDIIRDLVLQHDLMTPTEWEYFYKHETESPAVVGDIEVRFNSNHYSGNFFTTIINNLVNEIYHRYCFYRVYPEKWFDACIRLKVYGDDHILWIAHDIDYTGPTIAKLMSELGQVYTSDKKGAEIVDYQTFEEITFLGASPRFLKEFGRWVGAPRLSILFESVGWTKDNDKSLEQRCDQSTALAALYDKEFYDEYCAIWKTALVEINRPDLFHYTQRPYLSTQQVVATACSGTDRNFYGNIFAQSTVDDAAISYFYKTLAKKGALGALSNNMRARLREHGFDVPPRPFPKKTYFAQSSDSSAITNLTTIRDTGLTVSRTAPNSNESMAIKAPAMELNYGLESFIQRDEFVWSHTHTAGTVIKRWLAPWELINLGIPTTMQNMAFKNFTMWHGDVEVALMVNGQPFQQGLLCLAWLPLCDGHTVNIYHIEQAQHVLFTPNNNTLASVRAPYVHPRTALNTFAMDLGERREALGEFVVVVLSPLVDAEGTSEVSVTVHTRFPDSKFTLARPTPTPTLRSQLAASRLQLNIPFGYDFPDDESDISVIHHAQGGSQSTYEDNSTYTISQVAGDVPIQAGGTNSPAGAQTQASGSLSIPPMDAPPVVSGFIPTGSMLPPMSTSIGLKQTRQLDLHPTRMDRQGMNHFNGSESSIDYLCGKPSWLTYWNQTGGSPSNNATVYWNTSNVSGTKLFSVSLNSILSCDDTGHDDGTRQRAIPFGSAILQQFRYWRADIEITVRVVRNEYQSGKLRAVIAYAAPPASVTAANASQFQNEVLDYSKETTSHTMLIPYNASTQFLTTYEGPGVVNPVQDYSLGTFALFVATVLRCPDTVAQQVDVHLIARFVNVHVAIPRPLSGVNFGGRYYNQIALGNPPAAIPAPRKDRKFVAQSENQPEIMSSTITAEKTEVNDVVQPVAIMPSEGDIPNNRCMKLKLGNKFEFCVTNLLDIARRYRRSYYSYTAKTVVDSNGHPSWLHVPNVLASELYGAFFRAYTGSIQYRFHVSKCSRAEVTLFDGLFSSNTGIGDGMGALLGSANVTSYHTTTYTASRTSYSGHNSCGFAPPLEVLSADSSGSLWTDVKVPFNVPTEFSLLYTPGGDNPPWEQPNPALIAVPSDSETPCEFASYYAAGDDFRFGVFVPPELCTFLPFTGHPTTPPTILPNFYPVA